MRQKSALFMAVILALCAVDVHAQCKAFVKSSLPGLAPYIHDGTYQAVMMGEGEEAEIYKTVFAGQQYRLLVCMDDTLPNVEFVVYDTRGGVLYDNRKNENVKQWDFKSDVSQQIRVTVRVPKPNVQGQELKFGCLGVLFGLRNM